MPFIQSIQLAFIGGIPTLGYLILWYHELDEWWIINNQLVFMHYYRHRRRGGHMALPEMVPNGVHRVIQELHFSTQMSLYCRAK